ncbi:spartin [Anaeramoeba flamelloides]|uniref:Spartin n=1 Tax=Anaeramoeba flamelloides TaxID=1746091 RepID=A0AAV7Z2C1_9EUKA|nr:spartin [Anaeramoeba flamelloides]
MARISLTADEMILCSIEDFSIKIKERKKVYQVDKLHYVVPENDFFFGFAIRGGIDASNILVGSTLETSGCIFEKKYGKDVGDVAKNVTSSVKNLYKAKNEIKKIKTSSIQKIIKKKSKTVVKNNLNEKQNTNNEIKKNVNVNEIKQDGRGEMEENNKQNQNENQNESRDENQNIIINESGNKNENENENKESKK